MKVFIIILSILFGIVVLFRIMRFIAGAIVNNNPVDSITPFGTFGFRIGASKASTLSRIRLLRLASKEEWEEYHDDVEFNKEINASEDLPLSFTTSEGQFGHIKDITFEFKRNKLTTISILFDKRPDEIPVFMEIVEYRVSKRVGAPTYKGRHIVKWGNSISLYASLDEEKDENKELNLFIGENI